MVSQAFLKASFSTVSEGVEGGSGLNAIMSGPEGVEWGAFEYSILSIL